MHYIPSIIVVYLKQRDKLIEERSHASKGGVISGYALFVIYNGLYSPASVYGCNFNNRVVVIAAACLTVLLYLEESYKLIGIGH